MRIRKTKDSFSFFYQLLLLKKIKKREKEGEREDRRGRNTIRSATAELSRPFDKSRVGFGNPLQLKARNMPLGLCGWI